MELDYYKQYIIATVEYYPHRLKSHLKSLFLSRGIAQENFQLNIEDSSAVDVTDEELDQQLFDCILNNDESLDVFEEWEFHKDYRYSALFVTENFDDLLRVLKATVPSCIHKRSELSSSFSNPLLLDCSPELTLLKFTLGFHALHPQSGKELLIRYPVVVAMHKAAKIIEIRFDSLRQIFMKSPDFFYRSLVADVCQYIHQTHGSLLQGMDLDFLISKVQKKSKNALLVGQMMKMSNGSSAQLQVGKNEDHLLPFLGELKKLLSDYQSEFSSVPVLQSALEDFINDKEITSDYPWIEILLQKELKSKAIKVKITFDYYQEGYCLLQHYVNSSLVGMERMNHVIDFINRAKGDS